MSRRSRARQRPANTEDSFQDLDREALQPLRQNSPAVSRPPRRLQPIEDRRRWAPPGHDQAREATGRHARIVHKVASPRVKKGPGGKPLRSRKAYVFAKPVEAFGFADARRTVICLKRKVRRSVIFAFKHTGKGARARKRRNDYSNIRC